MADFIEERNLNLDPADKEAIEKKKIAGSSTAPSETMYYLDSTNKTSGSDPNNSGFIEERNLNLDPADKEAIEKKKIAGSSTAPSETMYYLDSTNSGSDPNNSGTTDTTDDTEGAVTGAPTMGDVTAPYAAASGTIGAIDTTVTGAYDDKGIEEGLELKEGKEYVTPESTV